MEKTTRILARTEYFQIVTSSIGKAKSQIACLVTGRKIDASDPDNLKDLLESIKLAAHRGVKVRYLLPKLPDRLFMGFSYDSAGGEVRFAKGFVAHSVRYVVLDGTAVIIATPQATGVDEPTRKGYLMISDELATIMGDHFERYWDKAIDLKEYIVEVMHETGFSQDQLASEIGIDSAQLKNRIG
jgi:phosphatidylserine/phosphatidylglycerophosphate/cardiolipin synthase-like enzyme